MKVQLGDKARCTITGFEGVVTCRSDYISGCTRITLQPPVGADGKIPDPGHFDEPMLEVVATSAVKCAQSDNGGPRPAPSQHPAPVR
jgi:hypothetical protein